MRATTSGQLSPNKSLSAARRVRALVAVGTNGATMSTPNQDSLYLTIPEAAQRLSVSQRFVERLIAAELLPVHRFGRAVRINRETLDDLAKSAATDPLGGRRG